MRILVLLLLALLLTGCAKVTVKKQAEDWDITYQVLWRQIEDLSAEVGDVDFKLGRASSEVKPDNTMVACLLAPHLCE